MRILGLRCSNSDYSFAVLGGTAAQPTILAEGGLAFPKGFAKGQCLKWFYQELEALIVKHGITTIVLKGPEGLATRDKSFVERTEVEAVAFLIAADRGVSEVSRKVKSTLAKDLGLKGKGKYLATALDTSPIADFEKKPVKFQEALLAAWSELA